MNIYLGRSVVASCFSTTNVEKYLSRVLFGIQRFLAMAMKNVMTQRPRSYLTDASFFSPMFFALYSPSPLLFLEVFYGPSRLQRTPPTHPRAPIYSISSENSLRCFFRASCATFPLILNVGCEGHVVSSSMKVNNGLFLFWKEITTLCSCTNTAVHFPSTGPKEGGATITITGSGFRR